MDDRTKYYPLAKEIRILYLFLVFAMSFFVVTSEPVYGSLINTYSLFALALVLGLFWTYQIEVVDDGIIVFRKIIGTVKIKADDVVSIATRTRCEIINCQEKKILLDPSISNLKGLKATLVAINPRIQLIDDPRFFPIDTWSLVRFFLSMGMAVILSGIALYLVAVKLIPRSY